MVLLIIFGTIWLIGAYLMWLTICHIFTGFAQETGKTFGDFDWLEQAEILGKMLFVSVVWFCVPFAIRVTHGYWSFNPQKL